MSRVLSPQDMEVNYLKYTAQVAIEAIKNMIQRGSVKKNDIPEGIYEEINEFFNFVLDGRDQGKPKNPVTCIANYNLAANVIRNKFPQFAEDRVRVEECMEKYAKMFQSLNKSFGRININKKKELDNLLEFFKEIHRWAESKSYQSRISSGPKI